MSSGYKDRVAENTLTTGTGSLTLGGAIDGSYSTFASRYSVGDRVYYAIWNTTDGWEVGAGTLSASTTLTRDTVFNSSNADALVSFTVPSIVLATYPAKQVVDLGHVAAFSNRVTSR